MGVSMTCEQVTLFKKIDKVKIPRKRWLEVTQGIKDGALKFVPDRENDLLTFVLANPEKGGRAQGLGHSYNLLIEFLDDMETYRTEREQKRDRRSSRKKCSPSFNADLTSSSGRLTNL